jgi:hypothetical protein
MTNLKRIGTALLLGLALLSGTTTSASADGWGRRENRGRHRGWDNHRYYAPVRRPPEVDRYYAPVVVRPYPTVGYYYSDPAWGFSWNSDGDVSVHASW